MANKIKLARGIKARIETVKSNLDNYEIVYVTDTNELGVKNNDGTITYFGVVTELEWANILNKPTFSTVATSGAYADLTGKPNLDLKLDKNFSALPTQTNPLLTDVLVINRGTVAQKVTLGNILAQVDAEIFIVTATLPATGVVNKIYLVPKGTPEAQNTYDEYIWVDNDWEKLGTIALDLSNVYNKTEVNGLLSAKVDKVSGKGLSTKDFTAAHETKLNGIATGAQVNVQSNWDAKTGDAFIKNKPASMSLAEGQAATVATGRVIASNVLKSVVLHHSPAGSRPASDVSAWAKAANKPTYTAAEVGLGNVDNTSDGTKYVQGLRETRANVNTKIWTGTEAQYDAIVTKDATTLYFITE